MRACIFGFRRRIITLSFARHHFASLHFITTVTRATTSTKINFGRFLHPIEIIIIKRYNACVVYTYSTSHPLARSLILVYTSRTGERERPAATAPLVANFLAFTRRKKKKKKRENRKKKKC